jgi:hypothetical protein
MEVVLVIVMFSVLIVAGLVVIGMAMRSRRQIREMQHRERLAMIERGLTPAPETDPAGFDEEFSKTTAPVDDKASRWRSAGIMMIGLGLAFMSLVSIAAGAAEVGVGVGGAFALIGAAFFVNSALLRKSALQRPPAPPPLRRAEPRVPPAPPAPDL